MRTMRFHIGRALMHLGLRVLPPGRCRQELTELMWVWNVRVMSALAAEGML